MNKTQTMKIEWLYRALIIIYAILFSNAYAYEIELGKQGKSYAVLIGINNYAYHNSLQTPAKNVEAIAKTLEERFDFKKECIYLLTDNSSQKPTREIIESQLISLGKQLTEKDQLLIYFSGHSQMDENGDTYWIPIDADKKQKHWISHRYLVQTIIAEHLNAVRHIAVLTEGYFSDRFFRVIKEATIVPKTQYKSWLEKQSYLKSREVLAFNDQFWSDNNTTKGFSLFSFHLIQALTHIENKRADLETSLLTSDLFDGSIKCITGTPVTYGRLKNAEDQGGQFVLEKPKVLPETNISECRVHPEIGYLEEPFLISCITTERASRVSLQINGNHFQMIGNNTQWKYQTSVNTPGKTFYYITPYNEENVKGKSYKGSIQSVSRKKPVCNIIASKVSPQKGRVGETFYFHAQTDIPAHQVHLYIDDQRYTMNGEGTRWSFSKRISSIGQTSFRMLTANEMGIIGQMQKGFVRTVVPPVNVIKTKVMPEWGYLGDSFVFSTITDKKAQEVYIDINGETYAMKGSGRDWMFKTEINRPGLVEYQTVALNRMKKKGKSLSANFSVSRKPLEIPDVMNISVLPDILYKGESVLIHATSSSPAKFVYIELGTQKDILKGSGTEWFYKSTIHKSQTLHFRIIAKNHRGMQGLAQDSALDIREFPVDAIKIIHNEISPKLCDVGSDIFFHVLTDKPAAKIDIILEDQRLSMRGKDQEWQLTHTINAMGLLYFAIIPYDQKNIKGMSYIDYIEVSAGEPKVKAIRISPEKPYIEEPLTIHVQTDRPARRMTLEMANIIYPMSGTGQDFYFKHIFFSEKSYSFTVQPYNLKDVAGKPKKGKFNIFEPQSPVPQIISVDIKPMETGFYENETILFSVETNVDSDRTILQLNDQKIEMNGVNKIWHCICAIKQSGSNSYSISAINEKGQSGEPETGQFQAFGKSIPPVNVTQINVTPRQGYPGELFQFSALTDKPADKVLLNISDTVYEMSGKDLQWETQLNGYQYGKISFYIKALNHAGSEGMIQADSFTVIEQAIPEKKQVNRSQSFIPLPPGERYIDHGNGLITDKSTRLMWLKTPKTIPETYDQAVNYCRSLNINGLKYWRLPTIEEWQQMIDSEQKNPALPQGHPFESIHTGIGYWSKTTHRFGPQYVYQMKLWYGKAGYMKKTQRALVWPVRYAGFD